MKPFHFIIKAMLSVVLVVSSAYADEGTSPHELTLSSIEWAYFLHALDKGLPAQNLVNWRYESYRQAKDEFERRRMLNELKPAVEETSARISAIDTFTTQFTGKFKDYRFDEQLLPLESDFHSEYGWGIEIENAEHLDIRSDYDFEASPQPSNHFRFLPLGPEDAESIVRATHDTDRKVVVIVSFTPAKRRYVTVYVDITRIDVLHPETMQILVSCAPGEEIPICDR
ncbi:hypothetical protein RHODOSMS8_02451 [Rhodobiaceae bacterium]|nr:hypothetical protein RHODOSMS8_02451 [Rhodobiaceae bacterium]